MASTNVPEPNTPADEPQEMPDAEQLAVAPDVYFAEDNTKSPEEQGNVQTEMVSEAEAGKK